MKNNLFYAMITAMFLMVGCGSDTSVATTSTGDSLVGKAGEVVVSTPVKVTDSANGAISGSDMGK